MTARGFVYPWIALLSTPLHSSLLGLEQQMRLGTLFLLQAFFQLRNSSLFLLVPLWLWMRR